MIDLSEYSIVQYVPDPIADERINIGVVVLSPPQIMVRFLPNWSRAKTFGQGKDLSHLKEFKSRLEMLASLDASDFQYGIPGLGASEYSPQGFIRHVSNNWSHQIQLTPLQRSLEQPDRLLARLSDRYLKLGKKKNLLGRTKHDIVTVAVQSLRNALSEGLERDHEVRRWIDANGKKIPNFKLDFGLLNGELRAAGQAVSFQTQDLQEIRSQWKEAVWSLTDLRDAHPDIPASLVMAKPLPRSNAHEEEYLFAKEVAEASEILTAIDTEAREWAEQVTSLLPVA